MLSDRREEIKDKRTGRAVEVQGPEARLSFGVGAQGSVAESGERAENRGLISIPISG